MLQTTGQGSLIMATTSKKTAAAPKAKAKPRTTAKKPAVKPQLLKTEAKPLADEAREFIGSAGARAKKAANTGKDKAASTMGDMANMVEDIAKTLDEKVGVQYGDYARKAASAVAGVADGLGNKDVDELMNDARDFVRKKPVVAIGAAAAVGFLLTRLIKAGGDDEA
jgi:ElaB/YqjD/DUF883 family membrane-anchored ribosome-binding protein